MITYGLTDEGFIPKSLEVLEDGFDGDCRDIFGANVPLGPKTVLGEYNGIMAERIAEVWELGEAIYASNDPDAATNAGLDALCALTGTQREPASPSTATLTLVGTPGTIVTAGSRAGSATTTAQFATDADATIALLTSWGATTGYVIGDRVTNASRAYICITAGTSAGSGGPTTTSTDITDNAAHWRYLGEGTGATDADARCTVDGPTIAVAYDLATIVTPIGGWANVTNLLDAEEGALEEADGDLRFKRVVELSADDATTAEAIREALLKPVADGGAGCASATVFHNDTDVTDGDGVPPHTVEALARGGTDADVARVIFAHVAAGIDTYSATSDSAVVTDSEGFDHTINFSRPTEILIYVKVTLTYDATLYPSDGDVEVKEAVVAFGDLSSTGKDAVAAALGAQAFKVDGVFDVPRSGSLGGCLISTAPSPTTDATIAVSRRQLAVFDTSRVTIVSSSGTP